MRRLMILAIPLAVTGCGIPPAVTVATYALDGVLLAASGKTVKDYALSAVLDQDCAMFRLIRGEPICMDYQPNVAAAEALEVASPSEQMLTATADGRVIRVAAEPQPTTETDGSTIAEAELQVTAEEAPEPEATIAALVPEDQASDSPSTASEPAPAHSADDASIGMSRDLLAEQRAYDETVTPARLIRSGPRLW